MSGVFWQTFAEDSSRETTTCAPSQPWDADKIWRVLEGKALVKIVDVEPELVSFAPIGISVPTLCNGLETQDCAKDSGFGTTVLEDSMRALSLGKK